MKKALLNSFLALSFLLVSASTSHANFAGSYLPNVGDAIPIEVIKNNNLKVYFAPLLKVENISYLLTYEAGGVPQGVQGSFDPGKKLAIMKSIFLGTCSQNVCTEHENITNLNLEVTFEFIDGSDSTKNYEIEDPFFY